MIAGMTVASMALGTSQHSKGRALDRVLPHQGLQAAVAQCLAHPPGSGGPEERARLPHTPAIPHVVCTAGAFTDYITFLKNPIKHFIQFSLKSLSILELNL